MSRTKVDALKTRAMIVVGFLMCALHAQVLADSLDQLEEDAQRHLLQGRLHDALRAYDTARAQAVSPDDKARLAYEFADTAQVRWSTLDEKGRANLQQETISAYQEASALGDPSIKAAALYDLGDFLVRSGESTRAVAVYQTLLQTDLQGAATGKYALGYARALEQGNDTKRAYDQYRAALTADVSARLAIDGAFRVLPADATSVNATSELVNLAIAKAEVPAAKEGLKSLFGRSTDPTLRREVLNQLGSLLALPAPRGAELTTNDVAWLREMKPHAQSLAGCLGEIETLHRELLPETVTSFAGVQARFECWTADPQRVSTLASMLANRGARLFHANAAAALRFLIAASVTDGGRLEAAVDAAALLASNPALVESESAALAQVETLFLPRAGATPIEPAETRVRGMIALGDIYVGKARWPDAVNTLKRALAAEQSGRGANPALQYFPGIHMKLANALIHMGDPRAARDEIFVAVQEFASLGNRRRAEDALKRVHDVPIPLTELDQASIRQLEQAVARLPE